MTPYDTDAARVLGELRADHTEAEYINLVWAQRYPNPSPKSSPGWPYRGLCEAPIKRIRVVK